MSDEPHFDIGQFGAEVRRVMVVAAHPDDLETTCGGTLALLIAQGVEVALLLGTDGDIGTHDVSLTREMLAATRRRETLAGAQALGMEKVFFLGYHDGELVADLQFRAQVAEAYRRWQPDTIFTFDPYWAGQAHPDHTAAGRAAVDAYMPSKMELYHPEQLVNGVKVADVKRFFFFGGSNREGEITVDISAAWEKKLAATRCHVSQFGQGEEALQWLADWNRETGKCCGLEYAEAFHPMRVW
ncbi:MAG: PIG-L family deacetylase [Chloroflexi bacterium]|nr:PIG-L family deacetylase [Chloroflexota bacterium]